MRSSARRLLGAGGFLVLAAAVCAAAALYDSRVTGELRQHAAEELEAVARAEQEHLVRWLSERAMDVQGIARVPSAAHVARGHSGEEPELGWLEGIRAMYGYRSASIWSGGACRLFTGAAPEPETRAVAAEAVRLGGMVFSTATAVTGPALLLAAPMPGVPDAALVLAVDLENQLLGFVGRWRSGARTAETQLLKTDGTNVVFLSRMSGDLDDAATPERAGGSTRVAVQAALGAEGLIEGLDYRGVPVLAVARGVPELDWYVVAKMDVAEALAPATRIRRLLAAGIAGGLGLCCAVGALVFSRRKAAALSALWERERARLGAEQEARRAAEHHRDLLEAVSDAVVGLDRDLKVISWNDGAERIYGWTRDEVIGRRSRELLRTQYLGRAPEAALAASSGSGRFEGVARQARKDGSSIYVEVRIVPLRDREGTIEGLVSVTRDITARHESEEALRASEERLQQVVEATNAGIWDVDLLTGTLYVAAAWNRIMGYPPASEWDLGRVAEIVHPDDLRRVTADVEALRSGGRDAHETEIRMRSADGAWRHVQVRGRVAARDERGHAVRLVGANVDVTERRDLQARLLIADRMSSMGMLAAGVAHEINNPLAYVVSNVAWAQDAARRAGVCGNHCVAFDEMSAALADAHEGALRVRDIVRDLRALSRSSSDDTGATVELARVVRSALQMGRGELRHRARIETDIADVPPVRGADSRLGQVVLNLLVNAAHALPVGSADTHVIGVAVRDAGDGRAAIDISDTGCGIPPNALARIFDPFFTTKRVGEGTGLGLSIAHGIVTGLGGEIRVESTVGKGSRFTVLLPYADAARPDADDSGETTAPVPARRARILVVDDEPNVGKAIRRMLASHYEVSALTSARDALRHVATVGCDAVVCDVLMPEMTGLALQRELAAIAPGLAARMIFMTGGAFMAGTAEELSRTGNVRLDKPFAPEQLLAAVHEAIA